MAKYHASDDGKDIGGSILIWIEPPGAPAEEGDGPASHRGGADGDAGEDDAHSSSAAGKKEGHAGGRPSAAHKAAANKAAAKKAKAITPERRKAQSVASAKATAATLTKAAQHGVPFCAECEARRRAAPRAAQAKA